MPEHGSDDRTRVVQVHDAARLVRDGHGSARAFDEREGLVVTATTTGRPTGDEASAATGHTMVRRRPT